MIKVEGKLLRLWEFFKWTDLGRMNHSRKNGDFNANKSRINQILAQSEADQQDFKPADLVLGHWLTYVFDFGTRVPQVWGKCFPIMVSLSFAYRNGMSTDQVMHEFYARKKDEFHVGKLQFKHRFGRHAELHENVRRTLTSLERYKKSLVVFMLEQSKDQPDGIWVRNVARGLHALTYNKSLSRDEQRASALLANAAPSEQPEDTGGSLWHKRLWAALRDYIKVHFLDVGVEPCIPSSKEYDRKVLQRWANPETYFEQLELPGDRWNNRFYDDSIKPLLSTEFGHGNVPKLIRKLYESNKSELKERGLYPEQLDVTFDLAQVCDGDMCRFCPLGPKGAADLCIGRLKSEKKYCPVLASIFHYFVECNPDDCPVLENRTSGLCANSSGKRLRPER